MDTEKEHPFRVDTMNSFNSLLGNSDYFLFYARYFGADKNKGLWDKVKEFRRLYHSIGNFIVIPNKAEVRGGINGARGNYRVMRDYFDWFLVAISEYQDSNMDNLEKFKRLLHENGNYDSSTLAIKEWKSRFFLEPYFHGDKPKFIFGTPIKDRLKIMAFPNNRVNEIDDYNKEYVNFIENYIEKSKEIIEYRSEKIVESLEKY